MIQRRGCGESIFMSKRGAYFLRLLRIPKLCKEYIVRKCYERKK